MLRLLLLFAILALSSAQAQKAASDVSLFGEVLVPRGTTLLIPPLFQALPAAVGSIDTIDPLSGDLVVQWSGDLSGYAEAAVFLADGRVAYLTESPRSTPESRLWHLANSPAGSALTDANLQDLVRPGDWISVVPLPSLTSIAGNPADQNPSVAASRRVHTAADPAEADLFGLGSTTFEALDTTGDRLWHQRDTPIGSGEPDPLVGPGHIFSYFRSASAPGDRLLTFSGLVRQFPARFHVPADGNAVPVYRLDGTASANTPLPAGFWSSDPATGFTGNTDAALADQLTGGTSVFWYQRSGTNPGWRRQGQPGAAPAPIVGGFRIFHLARPSGGGPSYSFSLPPVANTVGAAPASIPMIVDVDRDLIADGWEALYGGNLEPGDDLERDGFTAFQEYLLGGNPTVFDRPGLPTVEIRHPSPGLREVWVRFPTARGCRYSVQWRLGTTSAWSQLAAVTGTGVPAAVKHEGTTAVSPLPLRFYRVVGMAPADRDADNVSDWEEETVYATAPGKRDTDGDGKHDGFEIRTPGNNALDFYDGRPVSLAMDSATHRQVGGPGEWLRVPLTVHAKSGRAILKNAPITFVVTKGRATFSAIPADPAGGSPVFTVRTDSLGSAKVFVRLGPDPGVIQGRVCALVKDADSTLLDQLNATSFILYATPHLTLPTEGLTAHFRPDTGFNRNLPLGTRITTWRATAGNVIATRQQYGPLPVSLNRRPWLVFTGAPGEKLILPQSPVPDNSFSVFFVAQPEGSRTARTPNTAIAGANAGKSEQRYLFAGTTPSGPPIILFDPPPTPASKTFSRWAGTSSLFRFNGKGNVNAPNGSPSYWSLSRRYDFPTARGRYDATNGYRESPSPAGNHYDLGLAADQAEFVRSLGTHFANFHTSATPLGSPIQHPMSPSGPGASVVGATEQRYTVAASSWKGRSDQPLFGGVARLDPTRIERTGFALAAATGTMQTFELRQHWFPAMSPNQASSGAFIGMVRLDSRRSSLAVNGREARQGLAPTSPIVTGPNVIGGWNGTGAEFIGRLGDLVFYNRPFFGTEREQVEDFLSNAYGGLGSLDRDVDTLPDRWERAHFGGRNAQASLGSSDPDGDAMTNLAELQRGTNPTLADTDGDGISDGAEVSRGSNPLSWDTDADWLADGVDPRWSDPADGRADTNANGIPDGLDSHLAAPSAFLVTDSDGDSVPDVLELLAGTDPLAAPVPALPE